MPLPPETVLHTLRRHAVQAAQNAHVPYSENPAAAVLLLSDGQWIPGVRVESATFSLVIPALLNALSTAVAVNRTDILAAVCSAPAAPEDKTFMQGVPFAAFEAVAPDVFVNAQAPAWTAPTHRLDPALHAKTPTTPEEGIVLARQVADRAFVPASHFPVGCVLRTESGLLLPGVNVEHPDWSRILCAERNALGTAVSYGLMPADALYLSCPLAPSGTPCGACRQLLVELAPTVTLWMDRAKQAPEQTTPAALLPGAFRGTMLSRKTKTSGTG